LRWLDTLKKRWKLDTGLQVAVILLVFACTGFTVVLIKRPIFTYLFEGGARPLWANVVYYVLILPIYNLFLLIYGFIFGQFTFFWDFEKRFFARIFGSGKPNPPADHEK
jgi:hypothetical protein